ncbi:MAG: CBS domain-containing protein [Acidobacteria bacterium]|nr:CBS domain-containing protein [Acidobacteriota bacterium]
MLYLSQVLGRPVRDIEGGRVGVVKDVIVRLGKDHPPVTGLVVRSGRQNFFLPRAHIAALNHTGAHLNSGAPARTEFTRREGEVLLARDVLDKQLIDVDGKRVVRVNDVQLIVAGGEWRVTGADVSLQGLWRRLAPVGLAKMQRPVEVIDWADVGYLATDAAGVHLKSSRSAADLLGDLPEAKAEDLFGRMEGEEKRDVAELLPYADDEAGGLMTTEFVTLPKDLTVGASLARLREMAETPNMIYYLYVVEEENSWKLSGVIALRSLILADPDAPLSDVMRHEFQFAHPKDSAREVSERIAEYNLLALPVVDDVGDIAGIVTVDDAMELLLPKGWRQRLPRVFG